MVASYDRQPDPTWRFWLLLFAELILMYIGDFDCLYVAYICGQVAAELSIDTVCVSWH